MKTIVIIGAGFSGAITAVNLLRQSRGQSLRVLLVNRSGRMARGIAYGTASAEHVLNVPAGNMSALADDPDDFLRYCRWADPQALPSSFVSRKLYGCYLEALLDAAEHGAQSGASLERITGEAERIDVDPDGRGATVRLDTGRIVPADQVVLAFGHFRPHDPSVSTPEFYDSARYVRDPWSPGALEAIRADEPVLLLGSGLTAVDVALSLQARGARTAPLYAVSRRGLLPQAHREVRGTLAPESAQRMVAAMGDSAAGYLRAVRQAVRSHEAEGGDWRNVIAALRPHTPALWHRLDTAQRRRFLQRLQPYWDAMRHRCAPQSFERFQALVDSGALQQLCGRIRAYDETAHGVAVVLQPRGGGGTRQLQVGHVINCTGPNSDLRRVRNRLVRHLLVQQTMRPDALALGVDVDERYAIVDGQGRPSPVLRYIGPLLRARDWEATAVPELRQHAQRLAAQLLQGQPASRMMAG